MLHQNSVFHSLLKYVPWHRFERSVEKHGADRLSRKLNTKRHFIALLYGQLSGATSLREIVTGMASHGPRGGGPAGPGAPDASTARPSSVTGVWIATEEPSGGARIVVASAA